MLLYSLTRSCMAPPLSRAFMPALLSLHKQRSNNPKRDVRCYERVSNRYEYTKQLKKCFQPLPNCLGTKAPHLSLSLSSYTKRRASPQTGWLKALADCSLLSPRALELISGWRGGGARAQGGGVRFAVALWHTLEVQAFFFARHKPGGC
jgi:hypothetical protein